MKKKPKRAYTVTAEGRRQRSNAALIRMGKMTVEERQASDRAAAAGESLLVPPPNAADLIRRASEGGCSQRQIARALAIDIPKLKRWLVEYPELQTAMMEGRGVEHDMLVGKLHEMAMGGNIIAVLFALKAKFGYREGEAPVQNTVSVNFILPKSLTPAEYAARLAKETLLLPPGDAVQLAALPEVRKELAKDLKRE